MSLQKFLVEAGKRAASEAPSSLGRELEQLAVEGMAQLAAARIRARQARTWTDEQIVAEVKAARR